MENTDIINVEAAYKLDKMVDESKRAIGQNFLMMGKILKEIRDKKYFVTILGEGYGDDSFDTYLATKHFGSRSLAFTWIKIYETFIEKYGVDEERLAEAGWSSLSLLLPVVNDKNYDQLLEKAEALSWSDLKTELREETIKARHESIMSKALDMPKPEANEIIHHSGAMEGMAKMKAESVNCIITVPSDDSSWMDEAKRVLKKNGSIFLMVDGRSMYYQGFQLKEFGFSEIRDIIWTHKPVPSDSGLMRSHETVIWACNGSHPTCNIVEVTKDVWDIQEWSRQNHPSDKPEFLIQRLMEIGTDPRDVVLDPFCGAGTVLMVAKLMGRQPLGLEAEEDWYQYVLSRLQTENSPVQRSV